MNHRFDAQLLVQTQWPPFALEILLTGIEEMRTDSAEFWGATGSIEHTSAPTENRRVPLTFDSKLCGRRGTNVRSGSKRLAGPEVSTRV